MKFISKFIKPAAVASVLLATTIFSANAAIIEQEILLDANNPDEPTQSLGTIVVEVNNDFVNKGLGVVDSGFEPEAFNLDSFTILGTTFSPEALDIAFFEVAIDSDNVGAGLEVLFFDIQETVFVDNWVYNLAFDAFDPDSNFLDVFDSFGDLLFFFSDVSLTEAVVSDLPPVSEVSAPATAAFFSLALAGLFVRRKLS